MSPERLAEALKEFLSRGKDWERRRTSVPGIFVIKLPAQRRSPARLAVELNPVDHLGNPTKRRGLVIRNYEELQEFRGLINEGKLDQLVKAMDEVNPKEVKRARRGGEEVLEI